MSELFQLRPGFVQGAEMMRQHRVPIPALFKAHKMVGRGCIGFLAGA